MFVNKHSWEMLSVTNDSRRLGKRFITEIDVNTRSSFKKIMSTFGNLKWISMYNHKYARTKNTRNVH